MNLILIGLVGMLLQSPVVSPSISNHNVRCFAEDAEGHVWIGTGRGLNKYDTHEYRQYFWETDSLSLPDNQINDLHVDRSGTLWVATAYGAACYTERDDFRRVGMPEGVSWNVSDILETSGGTLVFLHGNDLSVLDPERNALKTVVKGVAGFGEMGITCHVDSRDRLWVVSSARIRSYDTSSFSLLADVENAIPAFHSCLSSDGKLYLAGMKQLAVFDTVTGRFRDLPASLEPSGLLKDADVTNIFQVDASHILLTTFRHGSFVYDLQNGSLVRQGEDGFPYEMPDFAVGCIFKDSQQNIWFGSDNKGFAVGCHYRDQFNSNRFLTSFFSDKTVISLSGNGDGDLFVSTGGDGLFHYSHKARELAPVDISALFPKDLPGDQIANTVFVDSRGDVWVLSQQHLSAFRCSFSKGRLTPKDTFFLPYPVSITEDGDGAVWITAGSKDIYRIRPGERTATPVEVFPDGYTWITGVLPAGEGKLIVCAFMSPLLLLDTETGETVPLETGPNDYEDCLVRYVFNPSAIYRDSDGDLWIATIANGLLRYSAKQHRLKSVPGAPCSDIVDIQEDNQGDIWVSSLYGLGKYVRSSDAFTVYTESDGIGGNEFSFKASCKLPDGTLVFGGSHGLTVFNPMDVPQPRTVPFAFEELKVHNTRVSPGEDACIGKRLSLKPEVVLRRDQNSFGVSFAALDYGESNRTRYSHRLEGLDRYWIDGGTSNEVHYANVPPGRYTLRVRISNSSRSILETEDSLSIRVLPSLWETWWMKCLYVLAALAVLFAVLMFLRSRRRSREAVRKAEEEKERERRINRMNATFFSNVAHEFRTPLTMISGPVAELAESSDLSRENRRLLDIVRRSVSRMLRLVNQIMDLGRLENASLRLKVQRTDVTSVIRKYLEIFQYNADNRGIELRSSGLEEPFMMWLDEDKLEKILANLLSNAMKFTPTGGMVSVSFDLDGQNPAMARIEVSDTGAGIPEEKLEKIFDRYYQLDNQPRGAYGYSTGIGLYYARSLAKIHHGSLTASNAGEGTGAVFTLLLPVNASAYTDEERTPLEDSGRASPLETVPALKSDAPAAADSDDRPTVMAVDDDSEVLQYLRALLDTTYNVVSCFSADSALRKIREQAPDIVLSDVVMPGRTGYELCRDIKSDMQISHIPVVLITARGSVREQVEGLDAGADAYVTKPFDPAYLKALLKSLLDNRAKLRSRLNDATGTEDLPSGELSPQDVSFMEKLYRTMDEELSNPELDINEMTRLMAMSRTKLYYKVKGLTGENPGEFFRNYKLNRAAELLRTGEWNISEIADMTGFSTLSHFSTCFKKKFGVPPSEYHG